jgi:tetratricopeptide (TPR) repeat protein
VPTRPTGPIDDEPWRPEPADLNITSVSAVPAADFVTESIDQVAGKAPTPGGQGHLVRSAAIATIFFGVGTGVGCLASRLLASRPEPPKYVAANTTNGNQAQPRQDGAAEGDLAQPNAWADVGKGTYHLQRREFDEAIKNFSHAIEVNPKFEYAYHRRGWCYFEQQRHDKAADDFAKASQLGPAVTSYRLDQAFAQISGKKYDQAIDVLTNLIAEQDDNMDALRMRSEAYQLSGRQEKADEDLLVIRRLRNKETSRDKDGAKDAPTVKVANDLPAAESAEPGTPASTPRPNKPRVRKGAEDREKTAKTSPSAKGNSEKLESEKREADDQPK